MSEWYKRTDLSALNRRKRTSVNISKIFLTENILCQLPANSNNGFKFPRSDHLIELD